MNQGAFFSILSMISYTYGIYITTQGLNSNIKFSSVSVSSIPRTEGEILLTPTLKSFSFNELKRATRNFRPDNMLGEGGFGCVFKGWVNGNSLTAVKPGTGMLIAVKRLNQESLQGHLEWWVSITSIFIFLLAISQCLHDLFLVHQTQPLLI